MGNEIFTKIIKSSKHYDISCRIINDDTLEAINNKYTIDNWLIKYKRESKKLILLHQNKKQNRTGKNRYHVQNIVEIEDWRKLLKKIETHPHTKIKKSNIKMNKITKILKELNK